MFLENYSAQLLEIVGFGLYLGFVDNNLNIQYTA